MDVIAYSALIKRAKDYTDTALASALALLPKGVILRGTVDYESDLPASPEIGDGYTVRYTGSSGQEPNNQEYVWSMEDNVGQWIVFGPDMSQYQRLLVSGTNIKTINNTSILGSGDIDITELFYCTYDTTTHAEITQALSDGKLPVCIYSNRFYKYDLKSPTDRYTFNAHYADTIYTISVPANNTWSAGSTQFEITSNKVTSISSSSTDAQYPSAKCVYDIVGNIETLLASI